METDSNGQPQSQIDIIKFQGTELPGQYANYILGKWKRSLRHGNEYFRLMENHTYNNIYDRIIGGTAQRAHAEFRLAVLNEDPDVVLGFSLIEKDILHYVFVQSEYRGLGLAKKLVPVPIEKFTHLTKLGMSLWNKKAPSAIFNPFA